MALRELTARPAAAQLADVRIRAPVLTIVRVDLPRRAGEALASSLPIEPCLLTLAGTDREALDLPAQPADRALASRVAVDDGSGSRLGV